MNEIQYHLNGQLMHEYEMKNGMRHGIQKSWYSNGNIHSHYFMINGQFHGMNEYYNYQHQTRSQIIKHHNFARNGPLIEFKYWNTKLTKY